MCSALQSAWLVLAFFLVLQQFFINLLIVVNLKASQCFHCRHQFERPGVSGDPDLADDRPSRERERGLNQDAYLGGMLCRASVGSRRWGSVCRALSTHVSSALEHWLAEEPVEIKQVRCALQRRVLVLAHRAVWELAQYLCFTSGCEPAQALR
jgi:hypothetical protein